MGQLILKIKSNPELESLQDSRIPKVNLYASVPGQRACDDHYMLGGFWYLWGTLCSVSSPNRTYCNCGKGFWTYVRMSSFFKHSSRGARSSTTAACHARAGDTRIWPKLYQLFGWTMGFVYCGDKTNFGLDLENYFRYRWLSNIDANKAKIFLLFVRAGARREFLPTFHTFKNVSMRLLVKIR